MLDHDPNFLVYAPPSVKGRIINTLFQLKNVEKQKETAADISGIHIRNLIEVHC